MDLSNLKNIDLKDIVDKLKSGKIGDKKITFSNAKISKKTINGNFKIQKIYK